jgi:hypothetical protein
MLIATALIGAVAKVATPRLEAAGHLEVTDRQLVMQLQQARLRAISEDRCFQISFNSSARTLQLASKRTVVPCGRSGFANDGAGRPIDKDGMIAVDATSDPVFDTWGNAPTTAAIKLTAPNGTSRTITVNAEGRINGQ